MICDAFAAAAPAHDDDNNAGNLDNKGNDTKHAGKENRKMH